MIDPGRRVEISSGCATARRAVGPMAWFVAEGVALAGDPRPDGSIEVRTTLRSLAESMALGRDGVAAAVARLRAAGYLAVEQRRDGDGRLRAGRWVLHIPGLTVVSAPPERAEPDTATPATDDPRSVRAPRRAPTTARVSASFDDQLSLLDPDPE